MIRILFGKLSGKKWIYKSHNLSIIFGKYEPAQTKIFAEIAKKTKVFWDLGSHVGYYSLLFANATSNKKHYAFEPLNRNADLYEKHMKLNGIVNYTMFRQLFLTKIPL